MSVNYGFFRSQNGDRTYTALQMNEMFSTLVGDGVFYGYRDELSVLNSVGMSVIVKPGRAMTGGVWVDVSSTESVSLDAADSTHPRYDAIVVHMDRSARTASLESVTGTPDPSPTKPQITNTALISEVLLAYVYVPALATSVQQSNITDGRSWVMSLLKRPLTSFRREFTSDGETRLYLIEYPDGFRWSSDDEYDVYVSGLLLPRDIPTVSHGIDGSALIELPLLESGTKISVVVRRV